MRLIVDWHIHSKYSRACSKQLELPQIAKWCERKGIQVVATGDWTHPGWFSHLQENLIESEAGIYRLRDGSSPTRFMLVTETSHIYKRGDKTRRVHVLVFSPSLETAARVNAELDKRGFNRKSDGRPILGMDVEEFYRMLKGIDERIFLVPAHAWTPWYSVFGSKSGFDSLEECFGEMTKEIWAIETGLSSDPRMNWRLSALDKVVLVSNSDAHSLEKLGREANVFEMETPSFDEFARILREQDRSKFLSTIEFFPEEGKYHFDGCASCQFSSASKETKRLGGRCPQCKRPMTLGVDYRVEELSDRDPEIVEEQKIPYHSIVPLAEILAEVFGVASVSSKRVKEEYQRLTDEVADEFTLLLEIPIEEIQKTASGPRLAEAIRRVRAGEIRVVPGYDGIFGVVRVFSDKDQVRPPSQSILF